MTEKVKDYIASCGVRRLLCGYGGGQRAVCAVFGSLWLASICLRQSGRELYWKKKTCEELRACGVQFSLGKDYLRILPEMDIISAATAFCHSKILGSVNVIERGQTVTSEMENLPLLPRPRSLALPAPTARPQRPP